ncbi:MAG: mechanosensitive ion channel [Betaproteobacteria bacterium]|nr:mechanosensitive ion channel [Betaproteobacteria bacterium]
MVRHWLTVVACLAAVSATAQVPGLPPGIVPGRSPPKATPAAEAPATQQAAQAAASAADAPEAARARIQRQLADARAVRDAIAPAPPGIGPAEIARQRDALDIIVYGTEGQLRALAQLEKSRVRLGAVRDAGRNWKGFTEPPPYSIRKLDALRDAGDAVRVRLAGQHAALGHLKPETQRLQDEVQRAEEAQRRADEAVEQAGAEGREAARWRRELAATELKAAIVRASLARMAGDLQALDIDASQAELDLVERQLAAVRGHVQFTADDLKAAQQDLAAKAAELLRQQAAVRKEIEERLRRRSDDLRTRERLSAMAAPPAAELAAVGAKIDRTDLWLEVLRTEDEYRASFASLAGEAAKYWTDRYAIATSADVLVRRDAVEKLKNAAVAVDRWRRYAETSLHQARARLMEAETKLASAGSGDSAREDADDRAAALRRLVMANDQQREFLAEAGRQLDRWVNDAGAAASSRDWRERLADGWVTLRESLRAVWNFELFAVEDTAVIDGQTVVTSRGVTIGKSIGALLLFVLGYGLVAAIARAVAGRLIAKGHDPARVRTVKRWALAISALALALLTLNVARIPFTVFAFLGGALAIGVGFGMQTIIKNLISGMIVLAERRIQIGDIVDVDGINGTVTTVDLRSTTVRSFEGLETMVPNSMLLENKVTNWTLSDRKVRRTVKVGVAYGTPMRDAAELLEACARRHGNVLGDPAPYVIFEDFADSAQLLVLHFWVELGPKVSGTQVASDLRFMIEKQFAEAGISIAYPQRDLHLYTARPLQVEVVEPPAPG